MDNIIVFSGPSGSGKTTLAKKVSERLNIPFIETSAGKVLSAEAKDKLKGMCPLWSGEGGHSQVIQLSAIYPDFGYAFQEAILNARGTLLFTNSQVILDRGPVDNLTYFLLQVGPFITNSSVLENFIEKCKRIQRQVTHLIRVPSLFPEIEDNNSRIASTHFQRLSSAVFDYTYKNYLEDSTSNVLTIGTTILEERVSQVVKFIEST